MFPNPNPPWVIEYARRSGDERLASGAATGHDVRRGVRDDLLKHWFDEARRLSPSATWEPRPDPTLFAIDRLEEVERIVQRFNGAMDIIGADVEMTVLHRVVRVIDHATPDIAYRRFTGIVARVQCEDLPDVNVSFSAEENLVRLEAHVASAQDA